MSEQTIGKYEIVSTLGRGSMGVVYKARDPEIGRLVAIKTLRSVFMGNDAAGNEALQRFRQESRSAGKLRHPNIVMIFEAGRSDSGSPYIVMEHVEGSSIEALLEQRGSIPPLEAVHYLAQVSSAIDYAHSENVIHRDIKPSNIIVDSQFRPHLLDFGVAKLSDTSLTPAGTVVGTPSYMSPEQIRGETLDGKTDIFALAVVAYEMVVGKRPFPGSDFTTVVSNIIHKDPIPFAEAGVNLPKELETALLRGLSKDRKERCASALELVDSMAKALGVMVDSSGLIGGFKPGMTLPGMPNQEATSTIVTSTKAVVDAPAEVVTSGSKLSSDVPKDTSSVDDSGGAGAGSNNPTPTQNVVINADSGHSKKSFGTIAGLSLLVLGLLGAVYIFPRINRSTGTEVKPVETAVMDVQESETPTTTVAPVAADVAANSLTNVQVQPPVAPVGGFTEASVSALTDNDLQALLGSVETTPDVLKIAVQQAATRGAVSFSSALINLKSHTDFMVRVELLKAFSRAEWAAKPEVFSTITSMLSDKDFVVRGFAAKVLGALGRQEAIEPLRTRALVEDNPKVKELLQASIGRLEGGNSATKAAQ